MSEKSETESERDLESIGKTCIHFCRASQEKEYGLANRFFGGRGTGDLGLSRTVKYNLILSK